MYAALGSVAAVQFGLYPDIFKQSGISPSSEKKNHENQLRIGWDIAQTMSMPSLSQSHPVVPSSSWKYRKQFSGSYVYAYMKTYMGA